MTIKKKRSAATLPDVQLKKRKSNRQERNEKGQNLNVMAKKKKVSRRDCPFQNH